MKKQRIFLCLVLCMLLMTGCKDGEPMENGDVAVYYLNVDGNGLQQDFCSLPECSVENSVEFLMDKMNHPENKVDMKPVLPDEVKLQSIRKKENGLELHFNHSYRKMPKAREVLVRAATVQTLVQIDGVEYVSFYIEDEALKDQSGVPVGLMSADSFVENTGSSLNSYQVTTLNLYFANKSGTGLVSEKISNVHYSSNTSMEKLIVEQLMKGPSSNKAHATIPSVTKLLGVSVKDGICYVNLDGSFLTEGYNQKPEVPIYSIVNSIIESGNANRVQILINGASDETYKGSIKLDRPLEWNSSILEEEHK